MTVSSTLRKAGPFNGNGVTTAFPFAFKVFAKADIEVVKTDAAGVQTTLVVDSDYSVALNVDQDASPGGTIAYPVVGSPLPIGQRLDVVGSLVASQPTDITNLGRFLPQVEEDAFDRGVILVQQLEEKFARAVIAPVGDTADLVLPTQAKRANKTLSCDDEGNLIAVATAADVQGAVDLALEYRDAAQTAAGGASDSASAAAASAIAALVGQSIFSTTALGLAGTSSGKLFGVQQTNSEAADVYLNSAGTAIAQNRTMPTSGLGLQAVQAKVAELASANLTPYPYNPSIEVYAVDSYDRNGAYVPNRYAASQPAGNLVALSSGIIQYANNNLVVGQFELQNYYATGPAAKLTANRVLLANGQYWSPLWDLLPAGTYTMKLKVQAYPGTTPTIRCGDNNAGAGSFSSYPLTDSVWTTITLTITADGVSKPFPLLQNSSGATVQFLLDEVQIYAGAVVPAYSTEVNNQGHLVPIMAKVPGKFKRAGNSLDTTGVTGGVLRLSAYPLQKSVSEITLVAVVLTTDNATAAAKAISLTDAGGSLDVGFYFGAPMGNPAAPKGIVKGNGGGEVASQLMSMLGRGYQVLATRCKASEQSFFWQGIEYARTTSVWGPVNIAKLSAFTDSNGSSFPLKGNGSALLVFEKWLTNSEMTAVIKSLKQRHALFGLLPITNSFNFVIAEGDSITSNLNGPASNGGYTELYFSTYTPNNTFCKNIAFSGSTVTDLNVRLADIQRMAPQALAVTGKPMIVSVLIGTNGILTTGAAAQWDTYLAAVRAAGAKIIACTLMNRADQPSFEANRQAFNTYVRSHASQYDVLCDFGADAIMGTATSYTDNPTYWYDQVHPSNLAHQTRLLPLWKTALESLLT